MSEIAYKVYISENQLELIAVSLNTRSSTYPHLTVCGWDCDRSSSAATGHYFLCAMSTWIHVRIIIWKIDKILKLLHNIGLYGVLFFGVNFNLFLMMRLKSNIFCAFFLWGIGDRLVDSHCKLMCFYELFPPSFAPQEGIVAIKFLQMSDIFRIFPVITTSSEEYLLKMFCIHMNPSRI